MPAGAPVAVDLRELRGDDLAPLLQAQAAHWQSRFAWDCRSAMRAVRAMLDRRELQGRAVMAGSRPLGHCYFVVAGRKAIIADLFAQAGEGNRQAVKALLESTLEAAASQRGVTRIEGQFLCLRDLPSLRLARPGTLRTYPRLLMLNRDPTALLPDRRGKRPPDGARLLPWSHRHLDAGAELVMRAYSGHVDSRINDQHCSLAGARRLLEDSIGHPASGVFLPRAGAVARIAREPGLSGMCLGALVGRGVGHVLQLCVAPRSRGRGLGSALLRRSLKAFGEAGCHSVSLAVTGSNRAALRLYRRHGFEVIAAFPALVWQRS